MEIRFNVTGSDRKNMVGIISNIIGMKAVYKFMPTCAYVIDNLTVSKDGTLIADERTDIETIRRVLEALESAGFTAEALPEELTEDTEEVAQETDPADEKSDSLVVSMPLDGFTENSLANLRKLIDSKQGLIKKALGTVKYTGVSGDISFDEQGDAIRDTAYIKTINTADGVWQLETVQTGSSK